MTSTAPEPDDACTALAHCFDCGLVRVDTRYITVAKLRHGARYRFACPGCGAMVNRRCSTPEFLALVSSDATVVDRTEYDPGGGALTEADVQAFAQAMEHLDRLVPFVHHSRSLFPGGVRRLRGQ